MAVRAMRERLAQDLGAWLTDGLISKETHELLRQRYELRSFGVGQAIKYLGISGGLLAFFGLLGLAGAISSSMVVASFLLLAVGAGLTWGGIWLSIDKLGRYGISSKVVLTLGLVTATLGIGVAAHSFDVPEEQIVLVTGVLTLPVIGFLAYRFGNIFVLILGLLGFFHWVGSWTAMFGRSTYGVFIQDPRLMSAAALLGIGIGIYHELHLRARTGRFFQAYEAVGLVYLNLSLVIMTIDGDARWGGANIWIAAFALAAIGQIVAGARLHNGLMTAFGVTAFGVNVYTRYFEHFWQRTHEGVFFLLGGLSLFGAGVACELLLKRVREKAA
ncbi:MAG: hypothetical protein IPL40_11720 [Proteobacteria bacterium]|nr:hypothetical protein [Pseudomonadota bacterium]